MNREDIICMAREASNTPIDHHATPDLFGINQIERFAALVASAAQAKEREACAKVCEDLVPTYLKDGERWLKGRNGKPDSRLKDLAPNLEAAWEAEQLLKHGSVVEKITEGHICAEAIRARGQA